MKHERQLLDIYVYRGEYREALQVPFRQHGRICASDGHVLIRIAEGLCEGEYTDTPNGLKAPDTSRVIPEPNTCETVTKRIIDNVISAASAERNRTCPECHGDGTVGYRYTDRHYDYHTMEGECPECGGTGEISDYTAVKYQFTIHGQALCYHHLTVLSRTMACLEVDSLRRGHIKKGDDDKSALLFDAEGTDVEILLMPQLRDRNLEEIKIKE